MGPESSETLLQGVLLLLSRIEKDEESQEERDGTDEDDDLYAVPLESESMSSHARAAPPDYNHHHDSSVFNKFRQG